MYNALMCFMMNLISINKSNKFCLDKGLTDLIKFLACLMIALHHYSQGMVVAGTHNPIYQLFSTQGGWLGVAIFFFLSGYGLMKSDMKNHQNPIHFFKNRLLRTYLPAVLISVIWGGYLLIWGGQIFDVQWILSLLWNFNDEVLWFVRAILKLYVTFYVYVCIASVSPKWFKPFCYIGMATIAVRWVDAGFVHGSSVLLFFIGMSIAEYDEWYYKMICKVYAPVVFLCTIVSLMILFRHDAAWIHLLINYFLIASGIIVIAVFTIKVPSLPKWIGGASYDVYLVHNKALMLLRPAYAIVPLWEFVGLAALFTIIFYNFRKFIRL